MATTLQQPAPTLHKRPDELARGDFELVSASYLELAEPNIDQGATTCIAEGAERVILVPYFLSAGIHVLRDLTGARDRLAGCFPKVEFRLAEPMGRHPLLVEVIAQRAADAGR